MNIPQSLRYTESHEWIRVENDGTITVGITDHAQDALGDIVFLELPSQGKSFTAGSACAVVESVKAASDIYAPVTGEIFAANEDIANGPEQVNANAYDAWLFKMKPANIADVEKLLDAAGYGKTIGV